MAAIVLTGFMGEQPSVVPRLLPPNAAVATHDVRLTDGGLTPIRESLLEGLAGHQTHQTIYRHGNTWLSWPGVIHAAEGPVDADRLYYTGEATAKMMVGDTVYPLAVPRPMTKPTATLGGDGDGDPVARIYAYTWVTGFGEESEPSPNSSRVSWKPGNTVTISNIAAVPEGRNVTHMRFYRTQTGYLGTYLYFIAERPASTDDFVDTIEPDAFGEPLPSKDWNAPPVQLKGLTAMPGGMMAAHRGKEVWFCEPWRPHAWPQKYVLTTDRPIVGLAAMGPALAVLTTGQPYLVVGGHPAIMQMQKLESNLPCVSARTVVDLGYAVAYASNDGLAIIRGDGSAGLVTDHLLDRDEWLRLSPATMIGSQVGGLYAAFYDTLDEEADRLAGLLLIAPAGDRPFLLRSATIARAAWFDPATSGLYYMADRSAEIRRFDHPQGARRVMSWTSKPFVLSNPTNFAVVKVEGEDAVTEEDVRRVQIERLKAMNRNQAIIDADMVGGSFAGASVGAVVFGGDRLETLPEALARSLVSVFADGRAVRSITTFNTVHRLPAGFRASTWQVSVTGNVPIEKMTLAESMEDLEQAPSI